MHPDWSFLPRMWSPNTALAVSTRGGSRCSSPGVLWGPPLLGPLSTTRDSWRLGAAPGRCRLLGPTVDRRASFHFYGQDRHSLVGHASFVVIVSATLGLASRGKRSIASIEGVGDLPVHEPAMQGCDAKNEFLAIGNGIPERAEGRMGVVCFCKGYPVDAYRRQRRPCISYKPPTVWLEACLFSRPFGVLASRLACHFGVLLLRRSEAGGGLALGQWDFFACCSLPDSSMGG